MAEGPAGAEAIVVERDAHRVAVFSDIHGNVPALRAVLEAIEEASVDLVVCLGDSTYGSQPDDAAALLRSITEPMIHIRGNGERAMHELRRSRSADDRETWMLDHHSEETHDYLEAVSVEGAIVNVTGLGAVRFCHGSPRSDIELITPGTPAARVAAFMDGVAERILVSGHTHIQFDRNVATIRSINPGSVGLPYAHEPGAYWAILGPGVELKRTEYDVEETVHAYELSGDPLSAEMIEVLRTPLTPEYVTEYSESLEFRE